VKFVSIVSVVVLLAAVLPCSAEAADYPTPRTGDWIVRDFRFHTGDVLPELRLHYTTVGEPTGEPVLLLHGTAGSASSFLTPSFAGQLFGPGQPLDARRHFIILPDAVGHGQSSRPSDGLRARFPRYNYDDMVAAQYRLLTEHLGVRHVRLVLGSSMGGMLTWIWGEMYPTFMDALVPLASEPTAMAGRNWMMRRMVIDAIRHDPGWNNGNYTTQPAALKTAQVFFSVATSGGARALYRATPTREETDAELDRRFELPQGSDANDVLFQFEAARDYDPAPRLDAITARLLAINSADDERNPPELGVMEHAMTRLRHGRYVLLPITDESRGHGTTGNAALWKTYLAELLVSPPGPAR
jgi:homoserine O-acetyltransferase